MMGILEYLKVSKDKDYSNSVFKLSDKSKFPNVVNFITANIRIYIDLDHIENTLVNKNVALLRTKQQGYVPLIYFPKKINSIEDEIKVKKVCSRILDLEKEAMKNLMNSDFITSKMLARVFTRGDIIMGDSLTTDKGLYVPYVDEKSVVIDEGVVDSKVKKIIKDNYIDKI